MKAHYPILLLILTVFAACQTEVEYNGEITNPKPVIFARTSVDSLRQFHQCFVQQSSFFLDNIQGGQFLADAKVEWQLNDGNRYPLVFVSDSAGYLPAEPLPAVNAGDRITLYVSHPTYGATLATQTLPDILHVQPRNMQIHTDTLSERITQKKDTRIHVYNQRQRIDIDLAFLPYPRLNDDVVQISAKAVYHPNADTLYQRSAYLSSREPLFHTLTTDRDLGLIDDISSLIREDTRRYDAFFIPVSMLQESRTASLTVVTRQDTTLPDSLLISVLTMTRDTWLYHATTEQQSSFQGAIIGLGQEEKVQVFGNFEGDVIGAYIATNQQTSRYPIR